MTLAPRPLIALVVGLLLAAAAATAQDPEALGTTDAGELPGLGGG